MKELWKRSKTNRLVVVAFLLSAVISLSLFAFQYTTTERALNDTEKQLNVIRLANSISSYAKRAEGHLLLHIILRGDADRKKFFKRLISIAQLTEKISPLLITERQHKSLASIKINAMRVHKIGVMLFDALDNGIDVSVDGKTVREFHDASSTARKNGVEIVDATTDLLKHRNIEFKSQNTVIFLFLSFFLIFTICLMFLLYLYYRKFSDEKENAELARDKAQYATRAKSEFLANMSHELRTPLNAIIGFSTMMETQLFGALDEKYISYANNINRSGEHLLELINDILDVSAIEAGKLDLDEEDLNAGKIVAATVSMIGGRANVENIILTSTIANNLPMLRADRRRIMQILLNLLSNAVKFTPADGRVEIAVSLDDQNRHVFTVIDTGIGMSPHELTKALTKFGQVDGGLNRKKDGTGLGLPLTQGLVELHGGTLKVDSKKGEGTSATVRFPQSRTIGLVPCKNFRLHQHVFGQSNRRTAHSRSTKAGSPP